MKVYRRKQVTTADAGEPPSAPPETSDTAADKHERERDTPPAPSHLILRRLSRPW